MVFGQRESVDPNAIGAPPPPTVEIDSLEFTLTSLEVDKETEDFAARVLEIFDSHTVPDSASTIHPLMFDRPKAESIVGSSP